MVELIYNNDYITVSGQYTKDIVDAISRECSYVVPTAEWSTKFQTGYWDGTITLFSKKNMSFPSGLLNYIVDLLNELGVKFTITDQRQKPIVSNMAKVDLGPHTFRDYQDQGIDVFCKSQRGILAICTAGGKTKISCGLISKLSVYPVIFVVPGVSLLKQTVAEFNSSLKPLDDKFFIGEIGGGVCSISPQGVNVATFQTLLTAFDKKYSEQKNKLVDIEGDKDSIESLTRQLDILDVDLQNSPASKLKAIKSNIKKIEKKLSDKRKVFQNKALIRQLVGNCQFLIIDETHIAAEIIEFISIKSAKAYYKCGLSATPYRTDNQDKRMIGSTGPIVYKIPASDLIAKGYLVKPLIYIIDLDFLDKTALTYQETYKNAIVLNQQRNELIRDLALEMRSQGRPTLIMVERIQHGQILQEMIDGCLFVPGDGNDDKAITDEDLNYRKYQLNRLEKNEIIMAATSWAFTGIDAPKVSCLILACSMASEGTTMQQVGRVLRKAEGKTDCVVFDFKMKEKSLKNHSSARKKVYQSEKEYQVVTLKYNSSTGSYV